LHSVFFPLLFYLFNWIYISISIIICLNTNIILINKFSKYNRVNISFCEIKYLHLHLSLNFFIFLFLVIVYIFFSFINTYSSRFIWLHVCIKFFIFTKEISNTKTCWKNLCKQLFLFEKKYWLAVNHELVSSVS
jgi:hypothetical protein